MEEKIEKMVAIGSFFSAVALAFTALLISPRPRYRQWCDDGVRSVLNLTATIFGIDYKWNKTPIVK